MPASDTFTAVHRCPARVYHMSQAHTPVCRYWSLVVHGTAAGGARHAPPGAAWSHCWSMRVSQCGLQQVDRCTHSVPVRTLHTGCASRRRKARVRLIGGPRGPHKAQQLPRGMWLGAGGSGAWWSLAAAKVLGKEGTALHAPLPPPARKALHPFVSPRKSCVTRAACAGNLACVHRPHNACGQQLESSLCVLGKAGGIPEARAVIYLQTHWLSFR